MRTLTRAGLAGALVACAFLGTLVRAPHDQPARATGHTVALGMDLLPARGQNPETAVTQVEAQLGRKLAFTRDFRLWDSTFPDTYERWLGARGTVPVVSVKTKRYNGSTVSWSSIAAAQPGSAIYQQVQGWAAGMRSYAHPVYFTMSHEPEAAASLSFGTSAQFVSAWQKIHEIFARSGATNVKFMWIMTSWAFQVPASDRRAAAKWYPGDAYVDALGADAYNWWVCNPSKDWLSMASVISGFMAFGRAHPTKRLWLAEFATIEDNAVAGRKAAWINDTRQLLKSSAYAQVAGVSYYNAPDSSGRPCGWPFSSSASAKAAMIAMARDPFYLGSAG